ncbi:dsDNA-mimic protein [Proteus sp. CD3]|uniref:HI1450 family dsDNA-mimic protein n=2 Tax=Morganellaceae TaxID=1903414 RepID=A0ABY8YDH8_9GAMM|nr:MULTISPECIES: HI1450 family dsDNA-mimic protein [Proteus]MBG6025887.1 YciU family protein [Proteus mirabilis]MBG6046673.1 YciU family protein [Proteus mirabilis]QEZ92091.1 dsDNA-mimic protein [Proteus sp. CD3]WIV90021.1 HI1450 family dsDNA-mimic protein [Proteus sp. HZ0627]
MNEPTLISEDDALEQAYDLFLAQAADNLDVADQLLFNLQFEERGAAEVVPLGNDWQFIVGQPVTPARFSEVIIGLAPDDDSDIDDIFGRVLISRDPLQPMFHIIWKS